MATLLNRGGYLVTAAHVTNYDDNNLVILLSRFSDISNYQEVTNDQFEYIEVKIKEIDNVHDICILYTKENPQFSSNLNMGNLDNVSVGETVSTFGYPNLNYGRLILTQQTTEIGAKISVRSAGQTINQAIINIQSRPGQSGGPVIRHSDSTLIGVVLGAYVPQGGGGISIGGIDPNTLHPMTHIVSSQYIKEMLNYGE